MPHSSGGGSHGGGFHGGSHGSSGRGGGSGIWSYASTHRVGRTHFSGSSKYVYYDNKKPVYVYANYDITKARKGARYLWLIIFVPIIWFELFLMSGSIYTPSPLDNSASNIRVVDKLNVLGENVWI